jgi:hypothetical protein
MSVNKVVPEGIDNIAENLVENPSSGGETPKKKNHTRAKNRLAALLGALILLFAAIGLVTTVVLAGKWIVAVAENQNEKDQFSNFIYPLVMQDPPAFESVSKLKPSTILAAGAWNFIINADTSKYEKDEFGFMTVPQSDIEVYATKLFGVGLTFEHQSIGDSEFSFTYNPEDGTYNISDSALFYSYIPRVTEIQRKDDRIHLRVEYLMPSMKLNITRKDEGKVAKVMEYILEETQRDSGYKIVAVETILSGNAAPSGSESSQP